MLTGLTDAQGRHWSYSMGTNDTLNSFTNPDSKTTSYTYDTTNPGVYDSLHKVTDARGNDINIEYDGTNGDYTQATKITRVVDGTTANDVSWTFNYKPAGGTGHACTDPGNGRTVETDPRGKLTTYCYNNQGQVVESWDALSRKQTSSYTAQANVQNVADTVGGTGNPLALSYASDETHNLTGGTEPAGATFALTYCTTPGSSSNNCTGGISGTPAMYRVSQLQDEQNVKTNYDYNATGDLTSVRANAAPTIAGLALSYNPDGTLASSTDGKRQHHQLQLHRPQPHDDHATVKQHADRRDDPDL